MSNLNSIVFRIGKLLPVVIVLLLNACGGSEPEETVVQTPTVDPRFATADAILDTHNAIVTQSPRVDLNAWLDLVYAENDVQRRLLATMRIQIQYFILEQAVFDKFGEHLNPDSKSPPFAPDEPSTMTEYENQRAIAEGVSTDGSRYKTYFVQIGDRWWISGYTMEHDPDAKDEIDRLDAFELYVAALSAAATIVLNKIESDEISSAEQVRIVFAAEVARRAP